MGSNCIDVSGPEQLIYIPCNFCNIILAVSVPRTSLFDIVTVCCGHCSNLWSVNMAAAFQSALPGPDLRHQYHQVPNYLNGRDDCYQKDQCLGGSSAKVAKKTTNMQDASKKPSVERLPNRLPEKKQRVPSAYNQFIKEEIRRIKANNPDISHREAFSTAAKNWAHFPHIHFGLMLENNKNQTRFDQNKAGKRLMCKLGAEVMKM